MFVLSALFNALYFLQAHPLYWQAPLALAAHSTLFAYFKHRVALEGKARITAWLTASSAVVVALHLVILGLPALVSVHALKLTAEQTVFYVGGLTLLYNFLKDRVVRYLQAQQETPAAIKNALNDAPVIQNSAANAGTVDTGVVTI